ncbi:hypothetical protein [Streptomyces misionensis]|uniref:hypothetical protein n=1 Tax=Streptomyces misionensis TaxID=67331 RepID=UPI0033ABDA7D
MAARPAVLAIALAAALAATVQHAHVTQDDGRTVPVNNAIATAGLTDAGATAATDPRILDDTGNTGITFTVVPVGRPSLTIAKSHPGTFVRGRDGVYTITVANAPSAGPTDGTTVTVHDTLPAGLRADGITGTGWHCVLATLTCTRGDVLPAGHGYPPITLKVDVSCDAPAQVTNTAIVTGGGDTTTHTATDPTAIRDREHPGYGDYGGGPGHCDTDDRSAPARGAVRR